MIPLEFMESWALYVVDHDNKHMLVMDPTLMLEGAEVMHRFVRTRPICRNELKWNAFWFGPYNLVHFGLVHIT
jgi:hypothetical protein